VGILFPIAVGVKELGYLASTSKCRTHTRKRVARALRVEFACLAGVLCAFADPGTRRSRNATARTSCSKGVRDWQHVAPAFAEGVPMIGNKRGGSNRSNARSAVQGATVGRYARRSISFNIGQRR
jgi:hypothetical protein